MRRAGLLAASVLFAGCAAAREVRLPGTERFELASVHTGRGYEIDVSVPDGAPPAEGWPVVYLLDGNAHLPVADKVGRSLVMLARGRKVEVHPSVIVGVGYPGAVLFDEHARADDYTPPAPRSAGTGDQKNTVHGGADRFLRFLEEELKPAVARRLRVDASRETLMGHSYGGLFALHVLLTRPGAFDAYVAGSPSLALRHELQRGAWAARSGSDQRHGECEEPHGTTPAVTNSTALVPGRVGTDPTSRVIGTTVEDDKPPAKNVRASTTADWSDGCVQKDKFSLLRRRSWTRSRDQSPKNEMLTPPAPRGWSRSSQSARESSMWSTLFGSENPGSKSNPGWLMPAATNSKGTAVKTSTLLLSKKP